MTQVIDAVVVDGPRITSVAYVQGLPGPPGPPGPPGSGGGGGGTLTGLTPHALLLGKTDGTVNQLGAATNGQFLIGQSGADPSWAPLSGDATVDRTGVVTLAASGVSANQYGDGSHVARFTVDVKGRVTAAASVPIAIANTAVSGLGTASTHAATDFDPAGTATAALATAEAFTTSSISALNLGTASTHAVTDFDTAGAAATAQATAESFATSAIAALGLGTSSTLNVDTDTSLGADSDTRVASQHAVKSYVSAVVSGTLTFKGSIDASGNPNYPAATKGDEYVFNIAGKIGGASGVTVGVGDVVIATANNAGGTQAAVGTSWTVLQHLLTGALLATNNLSELTGTASTARTNLGLGTASTHPATDFDTAGAAAAAQAASQPVDADLTSIAALSTTSFGRGLLTLADAAALRTSGGFGNTATFNSGTGTNQIVLGGVITAGGPVGDATTVPQITWNAAGQITAVTPVTIASDGIDTSAIHNGDSVGGTDIGGTYPGGLTINPGAVTLDDMADLPGNTMLGNNTSGLATPAAMSADDVLAFLGLGPISSPVPIVDGGTGAATQQAALDALAGAVTNNRVLAANGTHVTLRALTTADLPIGTSSSAVVVGGVITGAGPQGDGSHTQVLTFNNAGQLTTVTNTPIAIANTAVSGLGTMSTATETAYAKLAGRSSGQKLVGGTGASDNLTFQPSSNGSPTGDVIVLGGGAAGAGQIARFMNNAGNSKLFIGTGSPTFTGFPGIELDGGAAGSIYVQNAPFGAGYIGTEAAGQRCMIDLRSSRGTLTAPTHSLSGDELGGIQIGGGLDGNLRDVGKITMWAEEDFGASQGGTRWEFYTTPNGTTAKVLAFSIKNDGSIVATKNVTLAGALTGSTNMIDLSIAPSSTQNLITASFAEFGVRSYIGNPNFTMKRLRGTAGSPLPLQNTNSIAALVASGSFDTSGVIADTGKITFIATENWANSGVSGTAGSTGTKIAFATVANTTNTQTTALTLDQDQSATFTNAVLSTSATAGFGYKTGAGGTVSQATSRVTGVTINKVCGAITMFSAAGSATAATFTVTNSTVAATDVIRVCQKSGTNLYDFVVTAVAAGSFNITFFTTGGTATDAPVINFAVIKAVTA